MDDSFSIFKSVCEEAFRFLQDDYGFVLLQEGAKYNPYYLAYGQGKVKIGISGEGYGSMADIHYFTKNGFKVPYQCIHPEWQPYGKKRKRKKPFPSQEEQIFQAAKIILERDEGILRGDLTIVNDTLKRFKHLFRR